MAALALATMLTHPRHVPTAEPAELAGRHGWGNQVTLWGTFIPAAVATGRCSLETGKGDGEHWPH